MQAGGICLKRSEGENHTEVPKIGGKGIQAARNPAAPHPKNNGAE